MDLNSVNSEGILLSKELCTLVEHGSKALFIDVEPFLLHYFHIVDFEPFRKGDICSIFLNTASKCFA